MTPEEQAVIDAAKAEETAAKLKEQEALEAEAKKQAEEDAKKSAEELRKELEEKKKALRDANAEAKERRLKLEAYEAEEKKRKEADLTELEKAQKRAEEAEAKARKLEVESMQTKAAQKIGLPAPLASRLQGSTPEEMEADAKTILASLPKGSHNPTNPGSGQSANESDAERRKRLGLQ